MPEITCRGTTRMNRNCNRNRNGNRRAEEPSARAERCSALRPAEWGSAAYPRGPAALVQGRTLFGPTSGRALLGPTNARRRSPVRRMNRPEYWLGKFWKLRIERARRDRTDENPRMELPCERRFGTVARWRAEEKGQRRPPRGFLLPPSALASSASRRTSNRPAAVS